MPKLKQILRLTCLLLISGTPSEDYREAEERAEREIKTCVRQKESRIPRRQNLNRITATQFNLFVSSIFQIFPKGRLQVVLCAWSRVLKHCHA